jgi:hypothetical protein
MDCPPRLVERVPGAADDGVGAGLKMEIRLRAQICKISPENEPFSDSLLH